MSATFDPIVSPTELAIRTDLREAQDLGTVAVLPAIHVRAAQGRSNAWLVVTMDGADIAAIRLGPNAGDISNVQLWRKPDQTAGLECNTPVGSIRVKLEFHGDGVLRCTTSLLPDNDTIIASWPRDVFVLDSSRGAIHTHQRGLRSGIAFGTATAPKAFSLFYFQNFTSLGEYFRVTKHGPADSVGGSWSELGYAPPTGDGCVLPKAREFVISDAYLSFSSQHPTSEEAIAQLYLDMLAEIYLLLDRPATEYHNWPNRAARTLRDLSLSPDCSYVRQGSRFLTPYVGDSTKPPESMVQFTVAVNASEYDSWRGGRSHLTDSLRAGIEHFFDPELQTLVRWLPGEAFEPSQAEENMSHEAMDSWYYYHSLFNTFRFAQEGNEKARELFKTSLPFAIRVARRFNYRWPIFFNLKTLDIIRAEAAPGEGGESDVAGLYALVMLHAHEMFGDIEFLQEAEVAVAHLHGLGFRLAYQLNTTGFAAEAALRLWKMTRKKRHLGLAELCLANLFDNMWLWQCDYGRGDYYRPFFGLFPLRDAPYLAAYEELEAHAKFHEFLALGGDDVRPSLRLLIAEFQKYSLDRCWFFYPDAVPTDTLEDKARNGRIERSLSVPIEDMQDGYAPSGQVGQEVYGAGLSFVMTTRHYMNLTDGVMAFSSYPMFDFKANGEGVFSWRAGGDPRAEGQLRVFLADVDRAALAIRVFVLAGDVRVPLGGRVASDGHAVFTVRGGQTINIEAISAADSAEGDLVIGWCAPRPGKT
jgi:hypothetical protein